MSEDKAAGSKRVVRFPLSAPEEAELRALAENILGQSFEFLAEERVLPRSMYRPWIQAGRDYSGGSVAHDKSLPDALETMFPERFAIGPGVERMDFPWGYSHALLEGAVASATLAQEPYAVSSPSVQAAIDEFIEHLKAPPTTTILQVVTDINVTDRQGRQSDAAPLGQSLRIGEVEIICVGNNAEWYIERELSSAGQDVERSYVISTPGPMALMVARVSDAVGINARSKTARRRLLCLTSAIRLATCATVSPLVTIEGEPGLIRTTHPEIRQHVSRSLRLGNRAVTLGPDEAVGIEALSGHVNEWLGDDEMHTNPLMLANGRLNRSIDGRSTTVADIATDLAIGLEAALSGAGGSEVGLRLRTRAADLLATENDPADQIYEDVKHLYGLRSNIVHGRVPKPSSFEKTICRVGSAQRSSHLGEQVQIALDRWRDILRRAILVRAALADEPLLWSLDKDIDVEWELRSETEGRKWRDRIKGYWTDVGLPAALEPASPLQLPFSVPNDQ